jgi:hypothetical protein
VAGLAGFADFKNACSRGSERLALQAAGAIRDVVRRKHITEPVDLINTSELVKGRRDEWHCAPAGLMQ